MRIGSYLTLVILTSLLGGLALAGYFFSEHNKNRALESLASSGKLIQKDIDRLNDGISVLLLNSDQILGNDNDFIVPSTLEQFDAMIKLTSVNLGQLSHTSLWTAEEQEDLDAWLDNLEAEKFELKMKEPGLNLSRIKSHHAYLEFRAPRLCFPLKLRPLLNLVK